MGRTGDRFAHASEHCRNLGKDTPDERKMGYLSMRLMERRCVRVSAKREVIHEMCDLDLHRTIGVWISCTDRFKTDTLS